MKNLSKVYCSIICSLLFILSPIIFFGSLQNCKISAEVDTSYEYSPIDLDSLIEDSTYDLQINDAYLAESSHVVNNIIFFTFEDEAQLVTNQVKDGIVDRFETIMNDDDQSLKSYYNVLSNGQLEIETRLITQTISGTESLFVGVAENRDSYIPYSTYYPDGELASEYNRASVEFGLLNSIINQLNSVTNNFPSATDSDQDDDGIIDCLTFIYLNHNDFYEDENKDYNPILWPHNWGFSSPYVPTINGANGWLFNFLGSNRYFGGTIASNVKTMAHEMGHLLGFPDLYEVSNESSDTVYAFGDWDIMANSNLQYINNYFRYCGGWLENTEFVKLEYNGTYDLYRTSINESNLLNDLTYTTHPVAYYYEDPSFPNQKIVIEYRSKSGTIFDSNLSNAGILVYLIDENVNGDRFYIGSNEKSSGKPFSAYIFRENSPTYACASLDASNMNIGTSDYLNPTTLTSGTINFQTISPLGYTNSGIVITLNSIGNDVVSFTIESPVLLDEEVGITIDSTNMPDTTLRNSLRSVLGIGSSADMTSDMFGDITSLNLSAKGITDITGLDLLNLSSLESLNLNGNPITTGLSALSSFTQISNLQLSNCGITDISYLASCSSLQYLNVSRNNISDFSALTIITSILKVNLFFNNLNASLVNNSALLSTSQTKYIIGLQNVGNNSVNNYLGKRYVYFSSLNMPATFSFNATYNSGTKSFNNGINTLQGGTYSISYSVANDSNFASQSVSTTITIYDVILIDESVNILTGEDYTNDILLPTKVIVSLQGFNSSTMDLQITTTLNDETTEGSNVDTSVAGEYCITFTITSSIYSGEIELVKTVVVWDNQYLTNDENGIPDTKLYKQLLSIVGKVPDNVGTGLESGKLYSQDLYFYDIDNSGVSPITSLTFKTKGIINIRGLNLLNLSKITLINFNDNYIESITPLFGQTQLTELHLSNNSISLINGIQNLVNLTKLDLSYNRIADVSYLKNLTDPIILNDSSEDQNLTLVNLMFNMLDIELESNSFILDTSSVANYLSNDQIYIVLIQNLQNGDSYINSSKFTYNQTSANKYLNESTQQLESYYVVRETRTNIIWTNGTGHFTNSSSYNILVNTNRSIFLQQYTSEKFSKAFYVTTITLSALTPLEGFSLKLLNDYPNTILTTEYIVSPSVDDIIYSSLGISLVYEASVTYENNRLFINGANGTYIVNYRIVSQNLYDFARIDMESVLRTITVITNPMIAFVDDPTYTNENFVDRNLFDEILDILGIEARTTTITGTPTENEFIYAYDTYQLTSLNLTNKSISHINGLQKLQLGKLLSLRLNKNTIADFSRLTSSPTLKNLKLLDISENLLENSTVIRDITSTASTFYVNAILNNLNLTYANNQWLVTAVDTQNANKVILVGIQCLRRAQTFVSKTEQINSAVETTAGFYYTDANLSGGSLTFNHSNSSQDSIAIGDTNYFYNFFHYYKNSGVFNVTFNFYLNSNMEISNIAFTSTITHAKVYLPEDTVYIEVDTTNDSTKISDYKNNYDLVFEQLEEDDFEITDILVNFAINRVGQYFEQTIRVNYSPTATLYTFKKTFIIQDTTKPVIVNIGSDIIYTYIDIPFTFFDTAGIGTIQNPAEVYAYDNYDEDIDITYTVISDEGEEVQGQDYYKVPGVYTITYYASDSSGNEADIVTRTVYVIYFSYPSAFVTIKKPLAQYNVGEIEIEAYVMISTNSNPNPVFYWFLDGEYVGESLPNSLSNDVKKTTTFTFDIENAGNHIISLRLNNQTSDPHLENPTEYTTSVFVMLDPETIRQIIIISSIVVGVIAIMVTIIVIRLKKRKKTYGTYEQRIIKKYK